MILLKKRYKDAVPQISRRVLETVIYGICLEDSSPADADACYGRIETVFHDLNEVRVSSISELTDVFHGQADPEWRALRVRSIIQYVFEKNFEFDFEGLRRKTLDLANKQLQRIKELSPFVRGFTLQAVLGSHVVPVDRRMCHAAVWLGLLDPAATPQTASDSLKSVIRKSDAPLFCHLLRCLATESAFLRTFETAVRKPPEEGQNLTETPARLSRLFKDADQSPKIKKTTPKKKKTKQPAAKKKAGRGTAKTTVQKKSAAKKANSQNLARAAKTPAPKKKSRTASGRQH